MTVLGRAWRVLAMALLVVLATGCATAIQRGAAPADPPDPFEAWNRKVFSFNDDLDRVILKPVATAYAALFPPVVRQGVSNFFANMADAWSAVNNLLQGKPVTAAQVAFRFGVNTVFGFVGVLDLASEMGIERHYEDFGQTLAVWGMNSGAYLVWPLLGPSTIRDSIALPLNYVASPSNLIDTGNYWFGVWALQLVNTRADLLAAGRMLDDIALDKYTFVRDAFLQRRRSLIYDGYEPASPDPSRDDDAAASAPTAPAASDAAK